jgi:cytochrome c oxidase subunit 2
VAGLQLYESLGCVSCHGANGAGGRGPALAGLFGRKVFLNNNQTLTADESYIRESIENPQAKLVTGFGPIMPTFQGQVSPEQLIQLMAFIKSLQVAGPPPSSISTPPTMAPSPRVAAPVATPTPG